MACRRLRSVASGIWETAPARTDKTDGFVVSLGEREICQICQFTFGEFLKSWG